MIEQEHSISMPDGKARAHSFCPEGKGPFPAVLFYMDAIGVRPALRAMAEQLAGHGYYVLLPYLYYRDGITEPLDFDKDRARMMSLIQGLSVPKAMADAAAYLDFLNTQPLAKAGRVGLTGYCMGAKLALTTAGHHPARIAAAGCFHGAHMATDHPDSPHRRARDMTAELHIGVAGIDPFLAPGETDRLKGALEGSGVKHSLEIYADVQHGYAVPDLSVYDKAAAERHWDRLLGLLKRNLS